MTVAGGSLVPFAAKNLQRGTAAGAGRETYAALRPPATLGVVVGLRLDGVKRQMQKIGEYKDAETRLLMVLAT